MSSPEINEDMILEVLSYFPESEIGKARLVSKAFNEISYESWFLNLNIHRTNSISGYLIQYHDGGYKFRTSFVHERREFEENGVSINFLPTGKAEIKACDASHGILLCVNDTKPTEPEYIVCKPTTKQFQIIPNPTMKNYSLMLCLAVIQSNHFRYKILRLSKLPGMGKNFRNFVCEVFDSDLFTWKRLRNLRLPRKDRLIVSNPVQASGFLYWLSLNNKVIRFCLKTETWSFFQTPKFGVYPILVRYEGKLGVFRLAMTGNGEAIYRLWVLSSSCENSWVKVKDIENMGLRDNILWTPSNDVVTLCSWDRFCFYNVKTEKSEILYTNKEFADYNCFPFCSDYERVDMKERSDGQSPISS